MNDCIHHLNFNRIIHRLKKMKNVAFKKCVYLHAFYRRTLKWKKVIFIMRVLSWYFYSFLLFWLCYINNIISLSLPYFLYTEGPALQFVKTTHLETFVQRTVATVLVDSNATTLLDLVTLDVHQGTTEVNVKRVKSMTKHSLTLLTFRGLDFHDYFKLYWSLFRSALII